MIQAKRESHRPRARARLTALSTTTTNARYARVAHRIATDRCVILDGATGSELIDVVGTRPELDEQLWGAAAILDAPARVQALHRRYVDVGADIVTTDTWGLASAVREGGDTP